LYSPQVSILPKSLSSKRVSEHKFKTEIKAMNQQIAERKTLASISTISINRFVDKQEQSKLCS
jgi:hypothetical protein